MEDLQNIYICKNILEIYKGYNVEIKVMFMFCFTWEKLVLYTYYKCTICQILYGIFKKIRDELLYISFALFNLYI